MIDLLPHQIIALLSLISLGVIVIGRTAYIRFVHSDPMSKAYGWTYIQYTFLFIITNFFFIIYESVIGTDAHLERLFWTLGVTCSMFSYNGNYLNFYTNSKKRSVTNKVLLIIIITSSVVYLTLGLLSVLFNNIDAFFTYPAQKWFIWWAFIPNSIFTFFVIVLALKMRYPQRSLQYWLYRLLIIQLCIIIYLVHRFLTGPVIMGEASLWLNSLLVGIIAILTVVNYYILNKYTKKGKPVEQSGDNNEKDDDDNEQDDYDGGASDSDTRIYEIIGDHLHNLFRSHFVVQSPNYFSGPDFRLEFHIIEQKDYMLLVTCGMSSLPMHVPPEFKGPKYTELAIKISNKQFSLKNPVSSAFPAWLIDELQGIARAPERDNTFFADGHCIESGSPSLIGNAFVIVNPTRMNWKLPPCKIDSTKEVHFLQLIPINKNELNELLSIKAKNADQLFSTGFLKNKSDILTVSFLDKNKGRS